MKILCVLLMVVFVQVSINCGESIGDNDKDAFAKACASSYNLGPAICKCLAEKAGDRLTQNSWEFLFASMNSDEEKIAELRPKLSMSESLEAGMFMVNTPQECAEEMGGIEEE